MTALVVIALALLGSTGLAAASGIARRNSPRGDGARANRREPSLWRS